MDKPDAQSQPDDPDSTAGRPRLTPRPDGGGQTDEPIADILARGEAESTAETAAHDNGPPLTESQRVKHESLADLISSPSAERPRDDGQDTPPIAP